jgi:hypothetical protein
MCLYSLLLAPSFSSFPALARMTKREWDDTKKGGDDGREYGNGREDAKITNEIARIIPTLNLNPLKLSIGR